MAFWQHPTFLGAAGGTLAGTIAGAVVTGFFNYLVHQSDLDPKMVDLSIAILRAEPKPETMPLMGDRRDR
jgi:hypothetical protein